MISTIYGSFNDIQFTNYKEKLHKKLFWLLLYKDPKESYKYRYVDFDKYFNSVMREINGINEILNFPEQIVEIMGLLEAALQETRRYDFEYKAYRKLVLDAHNLIDKIEEVQKC